MNESITIKELYSLDRTIAASVFDGCIYPWEVLSKIGDYIVELGRTLPEDEYIKKMEMYGFIKKQMCLNPHILQVRQ